MIFLRFSIRRRYNTVYNLQLFIDKTSRETRREWRDTLYVISANFGSVFQCNKNSEQQQLDGCIVWNAHNTVLGSKCWAICVRMSKWASKDNKWSKYII